MKDIGSHVLLNAEAEAMSLKAFVGAKLAAPAENPRHAPVVGIPKISIVIPSYNQATFLERTILSVLNQAYPNLELIVIDGGSNDGSESILRRYSPYLSYWHSRPDGGQSDALNLGFTRATGDIYGWLNSDDLYLPNALTEVANVFQLHLDSSVVYGDWLEIDQSDNVTSSNFAFDFSAKHLIYEGFHLNTQAMFWRAETHGKSGVFDVNLHRTMDYDLILRMAFSEGESAFQRIARPLACFRRHPGQKTIGFDSVVEEEHRRIAAKHGFNDKFTFVGRLYRMAFRVRRAWWYTRRGGLGYALSCFFKRGR